MLGEASVDVGASVLELEESSSTDELGVASLLLAGAAELSGAELVGAELAGAELAAADDELPEPGRVMGTPAALQVSWTT